MAIFSPGARRSALADKLKLFFREPTIDTNRPIASGTVPIDGFDVEFVHSVVDADVWDCGFAARLQEMERERCVSVPAFPNRKFRLSYIFVNAGAGIHAPADLQGKRVAIRFWANTAGVWARGALQHHYNVDLKRIQWTAVQADETLFPEGAIDLNIASTPNLGVSASDRLDALLLSGAVDAVIDANVLPSVVRRDKRVRRLFPDFPREERAYFKATGIFPISHVVTLRKAFVNRCPTAPVAVLRAFRRARDMAFEAIEGSDPQVLILPWISHALEEQRALMGDKYFSYDIANNRTTLDAMMQFAHEQWLTPRRVGIADLFDPSSAALPESDAAAGVPTRTG
jgi:4,5-dihydroxyphthalate decarboxylase